MLAGLIRRYIGLITVEPIRFVFSFQYAVAEIVRQNLFIEKGKLHYIFRQGNYFNVITNLILVNQIVDIISSF